MTINQAFSILQKAGGVRAARIITDKMPAMSWWRAKYYAYLLRHNVPVAKIIHSKWFYGLEFYTNKYTLDPRPDTETLVSAVLSDYTADAPINILDLGTGTACIIGAIVKNMPRATGVGIDLSAGAIRVARRNIKTLGLDNRVQILKTSFNKTNSQFRNRFDIIVSNPPYIARGDLRVDAGARHDPKMALYANDGGLAAYKNISKNALQWIKKRGNLYLEIGAGMADSVKSIFVGDGWCFVRAEKDLAGIVRVLIFTKK